jgi:VIT1/CCC1 family predicted Fe2+/Mn2+ transporter
MTTAVEIARAPDLRTFQEHWQDESDASYLYGILAELESDPKRATVFGRLRDIEVEHARIWANLLQEHGRPPGTFRPSARARILAQLGKRFGTASLTSLLLREEGREVREYLTMHRETAPQTAGRAEALQLAKESAEHATELAHLAGVADQGEPWHRVESGGFLRNVVYGFNDGLTANFGLVAGVLGATATQQHEAVVVAGVAGVIADALSMGSSGYLAAKSELEVHAHEIAMERDEIAYMPELERDELALIYETKGMAPAAARALADEAMKDPERMLQEKVVAELGIGTPTSSPMREAWITGIATAVGAVLPVFPFFVMRGMPAIITSFVVAMAMHFLVGAARSVFTGRGLIRSGFDMFVVGLGVAVVGYFAGDWVAGMLGS